MDEIPKGQDQGPTGWVFGEPSAGCVIRLLKVNFGRNLAGVGGCAGDRAGLQLPGRKDSRLKHVGGLVRDQLAVLGRLRDKDGKNGENSDRDCMNRRPCDLTLGRACATIRAPIELARPTLPLFLISREFSSQFNGRAGPGRSRILVVDRKAPTGWTTR